MSVLKEIVDAPSLGVDNVGIEQAKNIAHNLNDFNAISTREESGTKLINSILGEEKCKTVLDVLLVC